jgi:hypothetical protein
MCDGNFLNKGLQLNTSGFIYEEQLILKQAIKQCFNIDTSLHFHPSGY